LALGTALLALVLAKPEVVVRRPLRSRAPSTVATVRVVDGTLQRGGGQSWKTVESDFGIAPGEGLRTSADGVAVLMFPWMQILVGGDSVVGLLPSAVLSASLQRGRLEETATTGDILKVVTAEGEVRGRGHVVVIRSEADAQTRVSALNGWFRVRSGGRTVSLDAGQGALVRAGGEPEIVDLPVSPNALRPGSDPLYVEKGHTVRLGWTGSARRYRVHALDLSGDEVVLSREVEGLSVEVPTRWLGTFQWRVSSIDERGVEGAPSSPGLFCVVEK
jgi:hypothetical protein